MGNFQVVVQEQYRTINCREVETDWNIEAKRVVRREQIRPIWCYFEYGMVHHAQFRIDYSQTFSGNLREADVLGHEALHYGIV